jgi:hypothetical protein
VDMTVVEVAWHRGRHGGGAGAQQRRRSGQHAPEEEERRRRLQSVVAVVEASPYTSAAVMARRTAKFPGTVMAWTDGCGGILGGAGADPMAVEAVGESTAWTRWHRGAHRKFWKPVAIKSKSSG